MKEWLVLTIIIAFIVLSLVLGTYLVLKLLRTNKRKKRITKYTRS